MSRSFINRFRDPFFLMFDHLKRPFLLPPISRVPISLLHVLISEIKHLHSLLISFPPPRLGCSFLPLLSPFFNNSCPTSLLSLLEIFPTPSSVDNERPFPTRPPLYPPPRAFPKPPPSPCRSLPLDPPVLRDDYLPVDPSFCIDTPLFFDCLQLHVAPPSLIAANSVESRNSQAVLSSFPPLFSSITGDTSFATLCPCYHIHPAPPFPPSILPFLVLFFLCNIVDPGSTNACSPPWFLPVPSFANAEYLRFRCSPVLIPS